MFSCQTCNLDFCHECKRNHEHTEFMQVYPYTVETEIIYSHPKRKYAVGSNIQIHITVTNRGLQHINSVTLAWIEGDIPFRLPDNEFNLNIGHSETAVIIINQKLRNDPGNYKFVLRLFVPETRQYAGPALDMNLRLKKVPLIAKLFR